MLSFHLKIDQATASKTLLEPKHIALASNSDITCPVYERLELIRRATDRRREGTIN